MFTRVSRVTAAVAVAFLVTLATLTGSTASASAATTYSGWKDYDRTTSFTEGDAMLGTCHFYARATQMFEYRIGKAKNVYPQVRNISAVGSAKGCILNPLKVSLGKSTVSQVVKWRKKYTVVKTPFKVTYSAGIPTPWGTIGQNSEQAGYVFTQIRQDGELFQSIRTGSMV